MNIRNICYLSRPIFTLFFVYFIPKLILKFEFIAIQIDFNN